MLPTLGARSFHAAAPELWNSLPAEIRDFFIVFLNRVKTQNAHFYVAQLHSWYLQHQIEMSVTMNVYSLR